MKVLFDSSTLVAFLVRDHEDHADAYNAYLHYKDRDDDLYISTHSVAEVFRTLTWGVDYLNYTATQAHTIITVTLLSEFDTIDLILQDYREVPAFLKKEGIKGPKIYDGLIARASEKIGAKDLITLNIKDFKQVWGLTSANLVEP